MTFQVRRGRPASTRNQDHREEQKCLPSSISTGRAASLLRCVRMCGEGMDVRAGVENRGASSIIGPNVPPTFRRTRSPTWTASSAACASTVCPVGALTSGTYRYKTGRGR